MESVRRKYAILVLLIFFHLNIRLIAQDNQTSFIKKSINYSSNKYWLEIEKYSSYHYNDFYIKNLNDYCILDIIPKFGLRLTQSSSIAVEPYIKANLIYDGLNNPWNRTDWHNNVVYGFGIRFRKFINLRGSSNCDLRISEFHIDFFAEKLWIEYLGKVDSFIGHRPTTDLQSGIQLWMSTINPFDAYMKNFLWGTFKNVWIELASSCYYTKSSFYTKLNNNFYFINMDFRVERLISLTNNNKLLLCPYLISQIKLDIGDQVWNKLDWHNYHQYGFGMRIKFYRYQGYFPGMNNLILGPYFHYLQKEYWCKVRYIPSYRPKEDIQLGFDLWISIVGKKIK